MSVRTDLMHFDGKLPDDEVHVWHTDFDVPGKILQSFFDLLDADEQARASRFKVAVARERFVISHAFMRIALGRYLQVPPSSVRFRITSHGKPELAGGDNLRFNLSYTQGAAVLAVARARRVGIDVELVRENIDVLQLAKRFFAPAEEQWLQLQIPSQRIPSFFACWTAKEAYIKALGEGMSISLAGFGVIARPEDDKLQLQIYGNPSESKGWSLWQFDLGPNFRCALAVDSEDLKIRMGTWSWAGISESPSHSLGWESQP